MISSYQGISVTCFYPTPWKYEFVITKNVMAIEEENKDHF